MENILLTKEEQQQVQEDRRKKEYDETLLAAQATIMQGIARNNNRSGERAIWELMQNAGDLSQQAKTEILLDHDSLKFTHQGESFDLDSLTNLIKQQSTKYKGDDKVGQYGTGFMTTHVFSRKVYISGDCRIDYGDNQKMYVSLPSNFCLDRSSDDQEIFICEMDNELKIVNDFVSRGGKKEPEIWTSFKYTLTSDKVEKVAHQLTITTRLMPFVLVFNDCIGECFIENKITNEKTQYTKIGSRLVEPLSYNENYSKVTTTIQVTKNGIPSNILIFSIESKDGNDRIIIPPLPLGFDDTDNIPSQFLFFPLLGTESFGTNFIFHSKRLYPTEARNSYLLPQDNDGLIKKYKHNEQVLDEMFDMLFQYYQNNPSQQNIPLSFAEVNFNYIGDDIIVKGFYEKLQKRFSEEFVKWKMIPTDLGYLSIEDDSKFVVLDNAIYSALDEDQLKTYIPVVSKYASQVLTIPNTDIVEWSKIVYSWAPEEDNYYIKLESICQSIKIKNDDLHTFLLLLKDLGQAGSELLATNALIPNREGILKKSGELRNGIHITDTLYSIAKPILGNKADKIVDPDYADIVTFAEYTRTNLRDEVKSVIDDLRRLSLGFTEKGIHQPKLLEELEKTVSIDELISYCSAFTISESANYRARLMPVICQLCGKDYQIQEISPINSDEPDLYLSAFTFLVDNVMYMLSQKPSSWLMSDESRAQNHKYLLEFATIFTDTKDEQRLKKLDDYGIIPNQLGEVNKVKDLKKNKSIDSDLQTLYKKLFNRDLKESFVNESFASLHTFAEYTPEEVGDKIEKHLKDINYEGTDIILIINNLNKGIWKDYFPYIYAQREELYYAHGSEDDKQALFLIQMQGSERMKRMAKLTESKYFDVIISKAEDLFLQQQERERQFRFTFAIGKLIEDDIRREVDIELTCETSENSTSFSTDDIQSGQDIVISYKGKPLYYLECKAKWNFNKAAHMSSLQIKQAVRESERYALCCIDCTADTGCKVSPDATDEEVNAAHVDILAHTYVHTNIGEILSPTISSVVRHEDDTTINGQSAIKVYGNFTCDIPKYIFTKGMLFNDFMQQLKTMLKEMIN